MVHPGRCLSLVILARLALYRSGRVPWSGWAAWQQRDPG